MFPPAGGSIGNTNSFGGLSQDWQVCTTSIVITYVVSVCTRIIHVTSRCIFSIEVTNICSCVDCYMFSSLEPLDGLFNCTCQCIPKVFISLSNGRHLGVGSLGQSMLPINVSTLWISFGAFGRVSEFYLSPHYVVVRRTSLAKASACLWSQHSQWCLAFKQKVLGMMLGICCVKSRNLLALGGHAANSGREAQALLIST